MIYLLPVLNALFGWMVISMLFKMLFHPYHKRNFFIIDVQGFLPNKLPGLAGQLGIYVSEHFLNIVQLKEELLSPSKLKQVNVLLEEKVDDFLRNKLKEKIPVFGMFVTEGLITKMKETLMAELENMIPDLVQHFAGDLEKKYDVKEIIAEKVQRLQMPEIERAFYQHAGKGINQLKAACAAIGFILGWLEIALLSI
jgi:uncharacterized membrane protein YheB (UPF0754 family)